MPRKIIYIVNPISGTASKKEVENQIASQTTKAGFRFRFFPSVADGNYSFLFDYIETEKVTDVVIVGGDGTVSQVIESLKHLPVNFGIIPCGSGNGLAFGVGIPKAVKKALDVIFANHVIPVDGFRINNRFACMLCGIGFDAQVAHDFAQQSERGLLTYVKQVFKNFFSAKAYPFEIKLNNNLYEIEAYFISIANSNQFGNNFTIAPQASVNDGLLDVVIITDQSKISFLYNTMMQVGGFNKVYSSNKIISKKGVLYIQTPKISITNWSEAPLHIDGEPVATEKKIKAVIEPDCFHLLAPKP